ncbi:cytochrome P450 [Calocera cornea HHB12733]|uniref:Cytochrome P450 n=1 Tax=Calocera cornea HHB12733 TaxID=1353952 RepID=A0A165GTZ9_9BASI|nr:cytochrome P450 [Calocera cornea HHB12733]
MFNAAIALLVLLALLIARDAYRKWSSGLPPGPPGLPLLGNLLQLPSQFLYLKLHAWSHQHGPVYTIWMGSQPFVVLGSVAVAGDLLDRMSAMTSDRPPMIKPRVFYFRDMVLMVQDRTRMWRAQRRSIHASLNVRATCRYNPMQEQEAAYLALELLQHPEAPFRERVHRFGSSVIFRSVYGGESIQLLPVDPTKRLEKLTIEGMNASMPQNSVVDLFPFLEPVIQKVKWLRKQADGWHNRLLQEAVPLYDTAVPTDGFEAATIVHDVNSNMEKYDMTKSQAVWMTVALFMAGQETSVTAITFFALALLHHPEVAERAQEQIDAVCGECPPTFADKENLPYVEAIVKETLRWRPGVPLSAPHKVSEDFEYKGYIFPKGTIFLDNLWSQTRDPAVYSNPEVFDPTRFLDKHGNMIPVAPDTHLDQLGFGHGRRVCPGRDFALNTMFIACAYMLWAFRFEWPVDDQGKEIVREVSELQDASFTVSPKMFGIVLHPRKEGLEERLLAALGSSKI